MTDRTPSEIHGRGTGMNPANRFVAEEIVLDPACFDATESESGSDLPSAATKYYRDRSRTILSKNDSPDIPFEFSINPYRGCEHGCIYCYARPTHEYLGFSAGLDFESRILVKEDAPALLRAELSKPGWRPQWISLSGNTDCYQPIERQLGITRRLLEVFLDFRNPVGLITKSALIARDADVLAELAKFDAVGAAVTVTTLDESLASKLEPRAARPRKRLETIARLAAAGVPVTVMVAPIVPGLTEHEIPAILAAAARAGATSAGYIVMRLPHGVKDLFVQWLDDHAPHAKAKVLRRLEDLRGGKLSDPRFGTRHTGEGVFAAEIADLFAIGRARAGLRDDHRELSTAAFRVPGPRQGSLF